MTKIFYPTAEKLSYLLDSVHGKQKLLRFRSAYCSVIKEVLKSGSIECSTCALNQATIGKS